MKYLAAYLLASMGGKASPDAKDILNILGSVGLDVDMEEANKVVSALAGKSVPEIIAAGKGKISSVPSGAGPAAAAPAAAAAAAPAAAAPKEAAKKEEEKEESDEDMGFGLFD